MSKDDTFALQVIESAPELHTPAVGPSGDAVRLHELRSLFDTFLPGWHEEELAAVAELQDHFQSEQATLESLLERGDLSPDEYASAVNAQMTIFSQESGKVLGEARAKQLFGVDDIGHVIIVDPERV